MSCGHLTRATISAIRRARSAKRPGSFRQLENHILDLPPLCIVRLSLSHDSRKELKPPAPQPELAIERLARQFGDKPLWSADRATAPKAQRFAVPDSAHPVVFFTDQIVGWIDFRAELIGEQQSRRRACARTLSDPHAGKERPQDGKRESLMPA
jgi:hypothetical protein